MEGGGERGIVTVDNVSPAHRCTSPLGVVPVGWEVGVGHCRDAASFPENRPFISVGFFFKGDKTMPFFQEYGFNVGFTAGYASS